ncbi:hypothetical protein GGS23DRAFT_545011 [Durotheca rogersii]|uniref:uncharacterized protein n=1 Tax=Durotheca rogersii TaxID=419775 RepID=UPI0022210B26|nr:uncharacterized protein GGS23DRAFT_545011 [Durotheca rogersii]KAI5868342.1 hypothetical protein GGS23DRAFT_545011 [Durotheca rogersii]
MLTCAVRSTGSGAMPLRARATASTALGPTSALLSKARHNQQTRAFRFGLWSSYLDPQLQRELQHRQRMLRHGYAEALKRKLSWDQRHLDENPKAIFRYMLRNYWYRSRARCPPHFADQESNDPHQHGRGDSDVRNARINTSWAPGLWDGYHTWKSHMGEAMNNWTESKSKTTSRADEHAHSQPRTASAEPTQKNGHFTNSISTEDYIIDPITNRKVPKSTYGMYNDTDATSADSFKAYRAQFATSTPPHPVHSNGPPPLAELKEYSQVNIDKVPAAVSGDGVKPSRSSTSQSKEHETYQHDKLSEQAQAQDPTKSYTDLDKYKTYGPREAEDAAADAPHHSEELKKYKPYMHNENKKIENQTAPYDDLDQYGPYKYQEDVKRDGPAPKYDDLDKYKDYSDNVEPTKDSTPKGEYFQKFDRFIFGDSTTEDQPFQQYGGFDKYRTFKSQELDSKSALEQEIVVDSPTKYDTKYHDLNSSADPRPSPLDKLQALGLHQFRTLSSNPHVEVMPPSKKSDESSTGDSRSRDVLEQSMVHHIAASDAADQDASVSVKELRTKAGAQDNRDGHAELSGNFVRDFPEDFSASWSSRGSGSISEPITDSTPKELDQRMTHIQAAENRYSEDLSKATSAARLETSLDRKQAKPILESALDRLEGKTPKRMVSHGLEMRAEADPYSKEPRGLETSYTQERSAEDQSQVFSKTYGGEAKTGKHESPLAMEEISEAMPSLESLYGRDPEIDGRPLTPPSISDPEAESTQNTEPTIYKILAYDPTMQKVDVAETTSIVSDQSAPLTPAEVLLRLSNPTKFFPHFAPLQAEGFEIVSGGGDVLVFRKVRRVRAADQTAAVPVNPIDMMGKPTALPNAATFTSPTGFVNYNTLQVEEVAQAPPFRSGIDVRREEPVFSGPKAPPKRKRNLGKRVLVGGAWAAGISYAIGVVSEYFATGGADGRGPTGF